MKKQFFRVKQLADQTLGKAEKSEVLNYPELQHADKQIDYLQESLSSLNKKIQTSPQGLEAERRMKKTLEYSLSQIYKEDKTGEPDRLFPSVFKRFAEIQHDLAKEFAEHEIKIEEMVGLPLQKMIDNDFPNITKCKKNLSKYILDKDSAANRYHSTKKDAVKEDMEEADQKVEQTRDGLAVEMFNVLSKESEITTYILQYLKLQRGFYISALSNLDNNIPDLEKHIGDSNVKKIFGTPLEEHLRVNKRRLAVPLEICITALNDKMSEEGLFRVAGSISKVKRLKACLDSGFFRGLIPEYQDVHLLASILKSYLRELPEPLLTFHLYNEWTASMKGPESGRVDAIRHLIARLPQGNRDNLAYLVQFLARLTHHKENRMNASNIAVVIGPSLLWNREEPPTINMGDCNVINMLVELFIKEVHTFFPEDVSKHSKLAVLYCEEEHRVHRYAHTNHLEDIGTSNESINTIDSPRPNQRAGKKRAPDIPSKTDQDITNDRSPLAASYPSGSTTLHRPPKSKPKSTVGVNTDENSLSISRANCDNLVRQRHDDLMSFEEHQPHKIVTQSVTGVQISKAKPVEHAQAQSMESVEGNVRTTAVHRVNQGPVCERNKTQIVNDNRRAAQPIAAPRSTSGDAETPSNHHKNDLMSRSEGDEVVFRKSDAERPAKPEVPARPASLAKRSSGSDDVAVHRTQCSLYSVASRQQPCIVNLQFQPGHDSQIAHKEKFLHQHDQKTATPTPRMSLIRQGDGGVGKRRDVSKSIEKLNDTNGSQKPSHVRTRSDGNIADFSDNPALAKTPPSPRSLNKPTQPPPPPPAAATVKVRSASDSTDL